LSFIHQQFIVYI